MKNKMNTFLPLLIFLLVLLLASIAYVIYLSGYDAEAYVIKADYISRLDIQISEMEKSNISSKDFRLIDDGYVGDHIINSIDGQKFILSVLEDLRPITRREKNRSESTPYYLNLPHKIYMGDMFFLYTKDGQGGMQIFYLGEMDSRASRDNIKYYFTIDESEHRLYEFLRSLDLSK